ncbi:hypothetical protein CCMSSC00406_0003669 [Pleurotus cornucopiae]|uniref:Uncharacterized protein n=1 Tax=Pleurotus cornucopiae TaxID=5321 RepID=A0ACB7IH65_PLECO|nr:hypothetical protein CCMSSC00406_0003669 [Pleurotus cornucopiae]
MSAPKAPQMNMVPTIDDAALSNTPAHEWAEGTSSALQSKLDDQSPQFGFLLTVNRRKPADLKKQTTSPSELGIQKHNK